MTSEEYLNKLLAILTEKNIDPYLKTQILDTVGELLNYYSVAFVQELLPSLLQSDNNVV